MKAGTTPLAVHVPEIAPISSRMRMAAATSPTCFFTDSSKVCQGVLYCHIARPMQTPPASIRATCEAPRMESAPKMAMSAARTATSTAMGMKAMRIRFISG